MTTTEVGAAYDARAREYVELFGRVDQLAAEDRALVSRWRDATPGRLLDAGCGPGQWTAFLHDGHRDVLGVDLSTRFLGVGRGRRPTLPFVRASMAALPLRTGAVGGVLAWYSIIHTPPAALPALLTELGRVLRPGGGLLLGFCDGEPGRAFAHAVVTAYFWSADALRPVLAEAGLEVVEQHRRQDPDHRPHAALLARRTSQARRQGAGRSLAPLGVPRSVERPSSPPDPGALLRSARPCPIPPRKGGSVTTKITLVIDNPADPGAFDRAYQDLPDAAARLPRLQRLEVGRVWPKEDGSPTPASRTLDLYFASYDDAAAAVESPEAGDFFGRLAATGTSFTGLFTDVEQREPGSAS